MLLLYLFEFLWRLIFSIQWRLRDCSVSRLQRHNKAPLIIVTRSLLPAVALLRFAARIHVGCDAALTVCQSLSGSSESSRMLSAASASPGAPLEPRSYSPSTALCSLRLFADSSDVGPVGNPRRVEMHDALHILLPHQRSLRGIDEEACGVPPAGGVVGVAVEGVEFLEVAARDVLRAEMREVGGGAGGG